MAAKQATTIAHLSDGRFTLNIDTGWYQPEIQMFGEPQMEHDERYERAIEWLEVIKQLWTRDEEFDFSGRFYNIKKGWLQPKPIQKPYPVVMNAGGFRERPPLRHQVLRRRVRSGAVARS
jgi:alkanesulfonate monooxygenase SsuD/methylene tetrahydromethanopterin reductase-like flavin-dependent oxidoreductase (luciferase family)